MVCTTILLFAIFSGQAFITHLSVNQSRIWAYESMKFCNFNTSFLFLNTRWTSTTILFFEIFSVRHV
jgi:hypothetical protein